MIRERIEIIRLNGTRALTHRNNIATILEEKQTMFGDRPKTTVVTKIGDDIESLETYETLKRKLEDK